MSDINPVQSIQAHHIHNTFTYIHNFGSGHTNTIGECLPKVVFQVVFQATKGFPENFLVINLSTNLYAGLSSCGCLKVTDPPPLNQI